MQLDSHKIRFQKTVCNKGRYVRSLHRTTISVGKQAKRAKAEAKSKNRSKSKKHKRLRGGLDCWKACGKDELAHKAGSTQTKYTGRGETTRHRCKTLGQGR